MYANAYIVQMKDLNVRADTDVPLELSELNAALVIIHDHHLFYWNCTKKFSMLAIH